MYQMVIASLSRRHTLLTATPLLEDMTTIGVSAPLGSSSKIDASRTKVVIRRLPPTLPEETFWKSVEPWVSEATCLWKRYVKGRAGEG
jgi:hypothetical protein